MKINFGSRALGSKWKINDSGSKLKLTLDGDVSTLSDKEMTLGHK